MASMGQIQVDIKGVDVLLKALDQRFGKRQLQSIVDAALKDGAEVIKRELEKNFESFKDTGASKDEITIGKPADLPAKGTRYIPIYWSGPKNRYTIIHLNEFGTIKNPNPRGKGAVERALRSGADAYQKALSNRIRRAM